MASSASPISPTTGAAIGTLTSISCGSTSSCTNLMAGFHLPRPNESIQLRRAPATITTSAFSIMVERHDSALSGPSSGISPLAIDMGRYGMLYFSMRVLILSSTCAYAAPLPRRMAGRRAAAIVATARSMASLFGATGA